LFGSLTAARETPAGGGPPAPLEIIERSVPRQYEDFVLGKIYGDWTFERGCDRPRSERSRPPRQGRGWHSLSRNTRGKDTVRGCCSLRRSSAACSKYHRGDNFAPGKGSLPPRRVNADVKSVRAMIDSVRPRRRLLQEPENGDRKGVAAAVDGQRLAFDMMSKTRCGLAPTPVARQSGQTPGRPRRGTYPLG